MVKFKQVFRRLRDPRAANASHPLLEVLFIALAAVLCGAQGPSDMAQFGRAKEGLLRTILPLAHGIPSHDTFGRVFQALDPEHFQAVFRHFVAAFAKANNVELTGVVAIDGKALRGAYQRSHSATPLHLVNVFASQARLALASRQAPGRNEAQGAIEVLALLSLEGSIVTADALHCSRRFAQTVLAKGAEYVLALKQNQSKLFAAVERRFKRRGRRSTAQTRQPSSHDRCEWRRATVIRDTALARTERFPGIAALARITSRRRRYGQPAGKPVTRYYLLSTYLPATKLLHIVRSHWAIENQLHWILDVVFNEDASRVRTGNAPENFATLRQLALNLMRAHPAKLSLRQKIKTAAWNDAFLLDLIRHMR